LVIALVGYSLGAPQYDKESRNDENKGGLEQSHQAPGYGSNQRYGNNREYSNSQEQGADIGIRFKRCGGHSNNSKFKIGEGNGEQTKGGKIQCPSNNPSHGNANLQDSEGTKGGRSQGNGNNQGLDEFRPEEHGRYNGAFLQQRTF